MTGSLVIRQIDDGVSLGDTVVIVVVGLVDGIVLGFNTRVRFSVGLLDVIGRISVLT